MVSVNLSLADFLMVRYVGHSVVLTSISFFAAQCHFFCVIVFGFHFCCFCLTANCLLYISNALLLFLCSLSEQLYLIINCSNGQIVVVFAA